MANYKLVRQLRNLKGIAWVFPMDAALVIARRASQLAPKRTGYMAAHIRAEKSGEGDAYVISEAPYSGFVEFGTHKMAAQPFMRPAIDEGQRDIVRAAAAAFNEEIRKALRA